MTASIGHNNPPKDRTFKKRWASAIFACEDARKPVGAVAMAFRIYHDMDSSGHGMAASDLEIAAACGVSDRSVRTFKTWLLKAGFVRVLAKGGRADGRTEYRALIPDEIELPEKSAGKPFGTPEAIAGKKQHDRKILPEIEREFPEKISGDRELPEKSAGNLMGEVAVYNNYARGEDNNIYKNNNNLPNITTPAVCAKTPVSVSDYRQLSETLVAACNGALDNPANCQGLAGLATPIMWINSGCDLQQDILPTLIGFGKSAHGKRIRSWDYFTQAVQKARDTRVRGLPPSTDGGRRVSTENDTIRQIDAIVRGGR